jgi:hypothetical protein
MKLKVALPSFDRTSNQAEAILRNRYVMIAEIKKLFFAIEHEILQDNKWCFGYSWCTIGISTSEHNSAFKDEIAIKTFLFGMLKFYEDFYDGPIVTWRLGPFYVNYRW